MKRAAVALAVAVVLAGGALAPRAHAFCRTRVSTKQELGVDGCPTIGMTQWWSSTCIGMSVESSASRFFSRDEISAALETAFGAWTQAQCPTPNGPRPPSIQVRNVGETRCRSGFDSRVPSQSAVIFRDDAWPDATVREGVILESQELAITTAEADPNTGELLGWTIEVNTAQHRFTLDNASPPLTWGLQEVLTHEAGHVLGLAHSKPGTVMYSGYGGGATLSADDVEAICTLYPPDGSRHADGPGHPSIDQPAKGCAPLPAQGFSRDCGRDDAGFACASMRSPAARGVSLVWLSGAVIVAAGALRRRFRRGVASRHGCR